MQEAAHTAGFETTPCNACGASTDTELFAATDHLSHEQFRVVRCSACGLAFVNPRPIAERIERYYPEMYYGKRHPLFPGLMMRLRVRKLPRLAGSPRLLDVGCGHGDFILACQRVGWTVAGVEQEHSPIMRMKRELGVEVYAPAQLRGLPSASFDAVTFWHVLEHLPDPAETLAQIRRLLKPGGVLLVEVPNFGGWEGRVGGPAWFHLDVPRHLYDFDRGSLEFVLRRQGFATIRWETFSLEYGAFGFAQTVLNRICRHPNHLFQLLIRRGHPHARSLRDTVISVAAFPVLLAAGLLASVVAAGFGAGGVLRVWARKPADLSSSSGVR